MLTHAHMDKHTCAFSWVLSFEENWDQDKAPWGVNLLGKETKMHSKLGENALIRILSQEILCFDKLAQHRTVSYNLGGGHRQGSVQ